MLGYFRRASVLAVSSFFCAAFTGQIASAELATRAIFVDRFDYTASNPSNITSIITNAANMGFTDVMFQVRGRGDAFYDGSIYEPKAAAAGSNDPLAVALAAAKNPDGSKKIRIHAWVNSMPMWNLELRQREHGSESGPSRFQCSAQPNGGQPGLPPFRRERKHRAEYGLRQLCPFQSDSGCHAYAYQ